MSAADAGIRQAFAQSGTTAALLQARAIHTRWSQMAPDDVHQVSWAEGCPASDGRCNSCGAKGTVSKLRLATCPRGLGHSTPKDRRTLLTSVVREIREEGDAKRRLRLQEYVDNDRRRLAHPDRGRRVGEAANPGP